MDILRESQRGGKEPPFFIPENQTRKKGKKKEQKLKQLLPRKTDPKITPEKT